MHCDLGLTIRCLSGSCSYCEKVKQCISIQQNLKNGAYRTVLRKEICYMENNPNDGKSYKKFIYAFIAAVILCPICFFFPGRENIQTEDEQINGIETESKRINREKAEKDKTNDTENNIEIKDNQNDNQNNNNLTEEAQESFSERSDIDEFIEEGAEILRRFQSVDWAQIQPRTYLEDPDWYTNVFCLAGLPEDGIAMYGYNDEDYHNRGVAIAMTIPYMDIPSHDNVIYYFDWFYFSPRQVLPQMYWNAAEKQLQITLCFFTGTGVNAEELHVLQLTEENELEDHIFANGEYAALLSERIGFSYEKDTHMMTLYDKQDNKELARADLSWLEENEVEEDRLVFGDIGHFQLGDEIYLRFTPGYSVKEWATPQYREIPEMAAQIQMETNENKMIFGLGEISLMEE